MWVRLCARWRRAGSARRRRGRNVTQFDVALEARAPRKLSEELPGAPVVQGCDRRDESTKRRRRPQQVWVFVPQHELPHWVTARTFDSSARDAPSDSTDGGARGHGMPSIPSLITGFKGASASSRLLAARFASRHQSRAVAEIDILKLCFFSTLHDVSFLALKADTCAAALKK